MTDLLAVTAIESVVNQFVRLGVADQSVHAEQKTLTADLFKCRSIDLYITSVCNRRCTFCFLSDDFFTSRARMTVEQCDDIVQWAADGNVEEITILGGEPATHPDFAAIVIAAAERGRSVRTVTNGSTNFRRALADERLVKALSRVAVSIDASNAETMDQLRGGHAFADALATVEALKEAGIPFDINCTVVRSGLDTFAEMPAFAEQLGAARLNVHWYSAVGRGRVHAPEETISATDWRDRVLEVVRHYRSPRDGYFVDCELGYAFGLPGEDTSCAVRGKENLQFFPSGAVFSCGLLVEDESLSGYVWRDGGLYERSGPTEVAQTKDCTGCRFRESSEGYTALCIYNRLQV